MDFTPKENNEMNEVATQIDLFLKNIDSAPFSSPAFSVLKAKINQHIFDLVKESAIVAKRDQADSISVKHVEIASNHLILKGQKRIYKLIGTVGGLAMGTCISVLCSMVLTPQFTLSGILICTFSGMIGSFLLALNFSKE